MKVQKFESRLQLNKVSNPHSNRSASVQPTKNFLETDPVNDALKVSSINDPILPQIVRKFKQAYNILFPEKVVKEAEIIKKQIDTLVEAPKFQAIA